MSRSSKYPAELREPGGGAGAARGKTVAAFTRDLSTNDTALGDWVKADAVKHGVPDAGLLPLTAAERAELTRLRRENAKLEDGAVRP